MSRISTGISSIDRSIVLKRGGISSCSLIDGFVDLVARRGICNSIVSKSGIFVSPLTQ